MIIMARVARNGLTLRLATSQPLTRPTTAEKAIAATKIIGIASLVVALKAVASTATVAISEATDRSSPRTRMTKVWPTTTMPSGAAMVSTLTRLAGRRKVGESAAATSSSATRKTINP
jgi:hypothetical protein